MNDFAVILQMALVLAAIVAPFAALVRLMAGREDFGYDMIVPSRATLAWPKGVQEEEPQPWRFGSAVA